jgi:transcriptional antiterminator RfaH
MTQNKTQDNQYQWFAIRTKPHQEDVAKVNYQRQHYEVYLPVMQVVRKHARKKTKVLRPFFPGYLFLHLIGSQANWYAIGNTRGSIGAVCFGNHYQPVPDWMIDGLKAKEENGIIAPWRFTKDKLATDDSVQISMSDGASVDGIVLSFQGENNVTVLLDFMQRKITTTVHLAQISKINAS